MTRPAKQRENGRRSAGPLSFPFREFFRTEAAGGVLLLAAAAAALVWANSPWSDAYADLWRTRLTIGIGGWGLDKPLQLWVNDALMAIFFFVVGLEIKREVLVGELATLRRAALPAAAAVGGALLPAAIYAVVNRGGPGASGWGVPMATDIAFALGVLALLGNRVPAALKVFLAAVAIVDDLLAVLVIAVFYTADVAVGSLAIAAGIFALLVVVNRLGVRRPAVYAALGVGLWLAVLDSGVHATIAGVLLATTIPATTRVDPAAFVARGRHLLDAFERAGGPGAERLPNGHRQEAVQELESTVAAVEAPLQRLEHALHPWVAFLIMPLFALANAGVALGGGSGFDGRVILGIVLGLIVGKQVGITLAAWLAVRSGLAELPPGVGWRHVYGVAWVAGIGFTMSLFIANLGFADPALLDSAKVGVLTASAIAGSVGVLLLRRTGTRRPTPPAGVASRVETPPSAAKRGAPRPAR
jgi:NhaA family Na+:H+ antiporter